MSDNEKHDIDSGHNVAQTDEKKVKIEMSARKATLILVLSILVVMGITVAIIALTPLKEFMPGYSDARLNKQIRTLSKKADSITEQMRQKDLYLNNILTILQGGDTIYAIDDNNIESKTELPSSTIDISTTISEKDSLLRAEYDDYKYSLSSITSTKTTGPTLNFYPPLIGTVANKFSPNNSHYGIDITAPDNEIVKSTLEGTIIVATWSSESNYIIGIQHTDNYFSLYSHNSSLIKKKGDMVRAGDPIAVIGKTNNTPNQNSLHFEIWHNGIVIDPEELISFNNNQ